MSTIKVNCPSCKAALKIAEEKLQATQGRVVCHECQHIFRLVKKSKKAPQQAPATPPKRPVFEDVGAMEDVKLNDFPTNAPVSGSLKQSSDPIFPTDGFPEEPKPKPKTKAKPFAKPFADLPPEQPPLHYRIPKAEARTPFADVNQQSPVAFNLLDYKTANQQVPSVNIKPPATVSGQTGDETKNNITIHTGSLVFTLTSDGQASASNTLPAESNKAMDSALSVQQAAAIAAATSRTEMNWTIATVAALIVLIVQLFYLVLMMS